MPKLQILWVNKNNITNLSIFIEKVASSFPDLRYLSMLDNAAAPSYFNGGSKQEYEDYRYNMALFPGSCAMGMRLRYVHTTCIPSGMSLVGRCILTYESA